MTDDARTQELLGKMLKRMEALEGLQRAALIAPDNIFAFIADDREIRFHLPYAATDYLAQKILGAGDFYESHLLRQVQALTQGAVVIDAGANMGNHTVFFSAIGGAKEVHAFEPQRLVFQMLTRNVELNQLQGVTCHNAALGAASGDLGLTLSRARNLGATSFHEGGDYPMTTIDALDVTPDLIKIDVEGYQLEVLKGAARTLERHRPALWIELREKLGEFAPADAILAPLGYVARALDRNNWLFEQPRR